MLLFMMMSQAGTSIGIKGQDIGGFVLASDVNGYPEVNLDVCDIKSLVESTPPNFEGKMVLISNTCNFSSSLFSLRVFE